MIEEILFLGLNLELVCYIILWALGIAKCLKVRYTVENLIRKFSGTFPIKYI